MTVINTNVAATVTANAMKSNQRSMETTMERLASGLRVNSAKDDAAGLAIGAKMDSQIRGYEQAVRNSNDGVSLLQTADGAAQQITGLLQRMRELAVQGQNGTNSTSDLDNLNDEFIALGKEIDRIADDTQFNGIDLLKTNSSLKINVGADQADQISLNLGDFNLAAGASSVAGVDTITVSAAAVQALGASGSSTSTVTLTNADGQSLVIDQTKMNATSATSGFASATVTLLAAAINTAITAAGTNFGAFAVSATSTTTITLTQSSAGTGSVTGISFQDENVTTSGTLAPSIAKTTVGGAGAALTPMGADLSAYNAAGDHVEATATIAALDVAIQGVNTARADFGSKISRLGYTIDNLEVAITNTKSAKSSIMDADYAAETTELARTQIISQAATAMLSQANQQAQSVLALLK
jgi:flagellin